MDPLRGKIEMIGDIKNGRSYGQMKAQSKHTGHKTKKNKEHQIETILNSLLKKKNIITLRARVFYQIQRFICKMLF